MTTRPTRKPAPRRGWLLALAMLFLAALACDDYYPEVPRVTRVEADPDTPGRAYASIFNAATLTVYETGDYGQTWQPSDYPFDEAAEDSFPLRMSYDETLYLNDQPVWTFPRSTFRFFFYDEAIDFRLPTGNVSNSLAGDTLYVAMGTEGVLVGHGFNSGSPPRWELSANGMDELPAHALTVTRPDHIIIVVALMLLVPPYALIHAYLLSRVWVYILPRGAARGRAIGTALGIAALSAAALGIWLTDVRTELYPIIGIMTVVTVLAGLVQTHLLTLQHPVPPLTRRRLLIATALLSLVVPAGVASIWAGWWLIFALVFGYALFQRLFFRFLGVDESGDARRERWRIDQLVLKTMLIIALIVIALTIGLSVLGSIGRAQTGSLWLSDLVFFAGLGLGTLVGIYAVYRYAHHQLTGIYKVKSPEGLDAELRSRGLRLRRGVVVTTVAWVLLAVVASFLTFSGQAMVYGFFNDLLQ